LRSSELRLSLEGEQKSERRDVTAPGVSQTPGVGTTPLYPYFEVNHDKAENRQQGHRWNHARHN
jgi:hypothetical protein